MGPNSQDQSWDEVGDSKIPITSGVANLDSVDIFYQTFGDPSAPPLILIMGLGMPGVAWHDSVCFQLAKRGFFAIRFDNRDSGRSSRILGGPVPDILSALGGNKDSLSYTLKDFAKDTVGLMEFLNIDAAHLVGVSMGGMIAQKVVIDYPSRVLSLCSIMSSTGAKNVGQPSPDAIPFFFQIGLGGANNDFNADAMAAIAKKLFSSPGFDLDEEWVRSNLKQVDPTEGPFPQSTARQLVAIIASCDRTQALKNVKVNTLVIHGDSDLVIAPSGGQATAEAIPGAKFLLIPGMGHNLPREVWPVIIDAIVQNSLEV